jgi:hypothetical protein
MAKRSGIYATEPVAKAKRIANTNPVGTVATGSSQPVTVPRHPGQLHGVGPIGEPFGHPSVKGSHGFGHVAHLRHGHLRLSGDTNAHRLGVPPVKGIKTPETDR